LQRIHRYSTTPTNQRKTEPANGGFSAIWTTKNGEAAVAARITKPSPMRRTSSDLRLNPRLHVIFLDGTYHPTASAASAIPLASQICFRVIVFAIAPL